MKNSIQAKAADAFVSFHGYTAAVCKLRNTSAVSIDYRIGGVTTALSAGESEMINTTASTSEVEVRRTDLSATPVAVQLDFGLDPDEAYERAAQAAAAAVAGHDASPTAHLSIQRRTLTGNLVLTAADLPLQRILPDADRDVTLPAEGATQWRFEICHGGSANTVTVKRAGGTVVASLIVGSPVVVAWDGVDFGIC